MTRLIQDPDASDPCRAAVGRAAVGRAAFRRAAGGLRGDDGKTRAWLAAFAAGRLDGAEE